MSSLAGVRKHVLTYTPQGYAWLSAVQRDITSGRVVHQQPMEHLACYSAGMLALSKHRHQLQLCVEYRTTCHVQAWVTFLAASLHCLCPAQLSESERTNLDILLQLD